MTGLDDKGSPQRVARAAVQRLESLKQAGVTHVSRPREKQTKLATLPEIRTRVEACRRCTELADQRTQTVFGVGDPSADLMFVGEAPGKDEDLQGEPFVGRAGQLLTDIIQKGMCLRREDVYICNILRCRPPGNRNPTAIEAAACREFLDAQIAAVAPRFVCCLGSVAASNLLGSTEAIGRMRGRIFEVTANGHVAKVVCTYHPAYLLRSPGEKKKTWEDIQLLMREMGLSSGGQ